MQRQLVAQVVSKKYAEFVSHHGMLQVCGQDPEFAQQFAGFHFYGHVSANN